MNSKMFDEYKYFNWNKLVSFINEHDYFNTGSNEDFMLLRSMARECVYSKECLFKIAKFIVERTEFTFDVNTEKEDVAYMMTMIYQYAVETVFTLKEGYR